MVNTEEIDQIKEWAWERWNNWLKIKRKVWRLLEQWMT